MLQRRNEGDCEDGRDSRAIWLVWARGVRGSAARGEGRGAAGATGFLARVAGRLKSLGLQVLADVLGCVGVRQEGRIKTVVLEGVDLSCLGDACEEMSRRQLYRGGWRCEFARRLYLRGNETVGPNESARDRV